MRGYFVKQYIRLFILTILFVCLFIPMNVLADDHVTISIDYGINGKIQVGKGFPMTITLTNQGESFSGDLVIFSRPNYETLGDIVIPVELPKGDKKTFQVSIPGNADHFVYQSQQQRQDFIRLYKGDWKNGEVVKLYGNKKFSPSIFPENRLVVGVLSDIPDTLNFLKLTKFNGEPIEFLSIKEQDLPNDAKGFEVFDVLVINDYHVANLSSKKQQALKNWVRSGGHLMIGSNPALKEQLGDVVDLSLLTITNQKIFEKLNFLTTKTDKLPSFKNVEIMTGDVNDKAKVLYTDHSLPVVINKGFGLGEVTQFAFNIGSATLTNWEPYSAWWEEVLRTTVDKDKNGPPQRFQVEQMYSQLRNIAEAFPSSFLPLTALIVLFIVYLLFLVPGLYLILKRLDKREYSWWIIPSVALLSSMIIFAVGAKDRITGSQLNDVSVLTIDDTGMASGYGVVSVLTNSGGDYSFTVKPSEFKSFPMSSRQNSPEATTFDYAMVENGQEQTKITFNDVEYWSIRSFIGDIYATQIGMLTPQLKIENNKLIGTITSSLQFDLNEAYLLSGNMSYELGVIKAGETKKISIDLKNENLGNLLSAPHLTGASSIYPGFNQPPYGYHAGGPVDKDNLKEWKKYQLLNTTLNEGIYQKDLNQPLIAGFTNDSLINVKLNNKKSHSESLTLVTQATSVTPSMSGAFTLTEHGMQPDLTIAEGSSGGIHHNGLLSGENFIAIEEGKYLLTYQFPEQMNMDHVDLRKIKLTMPQGNEAMFSLLNTKSNQFIALDENQTQIAFEEHAANEFLSKKGTITLMIEKNNQNNPEVRLPSIHLEGEYKK